MLSVKGKTNEGAFFADNGYLNASRFPNVGGNWSNGDNAGPFNVNVNTAASGTATTLGARLMCKFAGYFVLPRLSAKYKMRRAHGAGRADARTLLADCTSFNRIRTVTT
jgi:hypothetical protein